MTDYDDLCKRLRESTYRKVRVVVVEDDCGSELDTYSRAEFDPTNDPSEAADAIDTLRDELELDSDALPDVLAHLVAAVSILERGGRKAAPSNKMFTQMIKDYNASIERGRAVMLKRAQRRYTINHRLGA